MTTSTRTLALAMGALLFSLSALPNALKAATINLLNIAGTGARNFTDTTIWDTGTVPGSADFPVMAMGDGINDYVYVDTATTVQRINVGNANSGGLEIRAGATFTTNVTGSSQSNIGPGGASAGVGYLTIRSNATLSQAGLMLVGLNANGTGTVTLEAGGTHTLAGALTVGSAGLGTYNLGGALTSTGSNVILGNSATGKGTVNMTGGSLTTTASNVIVGNSGMGTINMSAGTLTTGTYLEVGNTATSNGTFKQSGGIVQINRSSTTAQGLFIAFAAGSTGLYEISNGSLNVSNSNTGILNGANAAGGGAFGTFRIVGSAPTISVGKDYTQKQDAKLEVVIDGGGISPINLGGSAFLDGILGASFTTVPTIGQQFPIINYAGSLNGAFTSFDTLVDSPLGPDTIQLAISYGSGANSSVVLTVVPEPSSMALLSLGLQVIGAGLLCQRNRRLPSAAVSSAQRVS